MASHSSVAPLADQIPGTESFGNDLPTYRALSALAITSAGAGLLSALSFVSWHWLILAGLALVAGFMADRRIRRMPDVLTGRSFAQAGIAMALIFGSTSLAYDYWTTAKLKAAATVFAKDFAAAMNEAGQTRPIDTNDVLWYMIPPSIAKGVSPEEAKVKMAEMLKNSDKAQNIDETIKQMIREAGPGNPITVANTEKIAVKDGEILVSVLMKIGDGRPSPKADEKVAAKPKDEHDDHDHADHDDAKAKDTGEQTRPERVMAVIGEGKEHALVLVHGTESGRQIRWYVDQIRYPYKPESFTPVVVKKDDDDGHGHAH